MNFHIVDTESAYRRLLAAPDAAAREQIFRDELIQPFQGLVNYFGGDGPRAFAMWGMTPAQFAPERHDEMRAKLDALAGADAWNRAVRALEKGRDAFAPFADRIPLDNVVFGLMLGDMSSVPGQRGYTGFGGIAGWIMTVYGEPDEYNLARVEAATVHELHHNIAGAGGAVLNNRKDFNTVTVGEYMVGEGLAESFAAALYGEDLIGPWVSEFQDPNPERTKAIFREGLNRSGFDVVRGYIFGGPMADHGGFEAVDVPLLAGYALGYRIVQDYLKRTGKSVPEATFVTANEIIAESRFFA